MAITILPRPDRGESWGETLGRGLGAGIQALSQGKISRMNQDYMANRLRSHGQDPTLAYLPESYQKEGYKQSLQNTYAQQAAAQKAAAELPSLEMQSDFLNKGLGTNVFNPTMLNTKFGQSLASKVLESQIAKEAIQEKAASAPMTIGESIGKAFGFTPERMKKQRTILQKVGSKRKIAPQELFDNETIQEMRRRGLDPQEVVDRLQDEHVQSQAADQTKTQQEKLENEARAKEGLPPIESDGAQEINPLQYLSSGLVGGAQGAAAISPTFLPQTLASGVLTGINALTNATMGKQFLPSYEDLQNRIPTVKSAADDAMNVMKQYGLLPQDAPNESMLQEAPLKPMPTSSQVSELLKRQTEGTSLEKYVRPQSRGQEIAENIGELASLAYSGGATGLAGKSKEATKALAKAVGAETAGWLTENYTGSKIAGRIASNGFFLASSLFPGTFRQLSEKRAAEFEKIIIEPAEKLGYKVDFDPHMKEWERITKEVSKMPAESAERTVLEEALKQVGSLADGKGMVDPKALVNTSKIQSQQIANAPKEAQKLLSEIVHVQEQGLADMGRKINKSAANALGESNSLARTAGINEATRQAIVNKIPMRQLGLGTILYYTGGYPIAMAAAGLAYGGNTLLNAMKNPAMRSAFGKTLKAGAAGNAAAINKSALQFDKAFKKEEPGLYNDIEKYRDKILPAMRQYMS
jgi:hypothetical protein